MHKYAQNYAKIMQIICRICTSLLVCIGIFCMYMHSRAPLCWSWWIMWPGCPSLAKLYIIHRTGLGCCWPGMLLPNSRGYQSYSEHPPSFRVSNCSDRPGRLEPRARTTWPGNQEIPPLIKFPSRFSPSSHHRDGFQPLATQSSSQPRRPEAQEQNSPLKPFNAYSVSRLFITRDQIWTYHLIFSFYRHKLL